MAIRQILDSDATPAGTVELQVPRKTGKAWNGTVHVFEVSGHPRATRCYAWPEALDERTVIVRVVPHSGRIRSPQQAVRAILNRRQNRQPGRSALRPSKS